MKIMPISMNYKYANTVNRQIYGTKQLSFDIEKTDSVGFNARAWDQKALRILERTPQEMVELGKTFHDSDDKLLRKVARITNKIGFKKEDESDFAYRKLRYAVNQALKLKSEWLRNLAVLEKKEIEDKENLYKKRMIIQENFFDFLQAEKAGKLVPIENGILIKSENEDFLNWVKDTSGLEFKQVNFDINDPKSSFTDVVMVMEAAKIKKQQNGCRTLLYIKDLDQALCRFDTAKDRRVLGLFKNIIENCAAETNTTIITTTTKDFSLFEDASIAGHRFGIKVDATRKISQRELDSIKKYKENLDDMNELAERKDRFRKPKVDRDDFYDDNHDMYGNLWGSPSFV